MRFYGWVIILFILFFSSSVLLYLLYGHVETNIYQLEKPPMFQIKNQEDKTSFLSKQLNDIHNLSLLTKDIIGNKVFVGRINFDFKENFLSVKPLNKRSYEDLTSFLISTGENYKEKRVDYELYGLKLPYYQFLTNNVYVELTPVIFVLDLENIDENVINYLKSRYYIFTKSAYRPYSFNQTLLNALNDYGGIILDNSIIDNAAVQPTINALVQEGINIVYDYSILLFER
ncbi:hypothetical protein [Petrotoga sp. 9PWA.NaAc.5.4]|uniref:hypothetical protein n=1 Tax=Petrotoga sp. 9PWA.NaAc.5.4 TaxID=1434328 RepID=UPI000CC6409B|nr:hypothetical protein [Petrotoga sp. 9PWA.NaAc.5.4]PNR97239.1 hypothetical protein X924_01310 [Petrotoga sp. 9PWA.NaAc.5.4]